MAAMEYGQYFLPSKQLEETFKTVGGTPIKLKVIYSEKSTTTPAPVLLYWHGGYLVIGDRKDHPIWVTNACLRRGWVFVTADYRLMPESTGLDILEDLRDAYDFVRNRLSSLLPYKIDTSRIAFAGSSAGGYCALLATTELSPPPRATFLIYPVANPSSDRYVHKGNLLVNAPQGTNSEKVFAEIDGKIARKEICVGQPLAHRPDTRTSQYMRYMLQDGKFADYLAGVPGLADKVLEFGEEKGVPDHVKKVFPTAFSIRKNLPPMVIVHGRADRSVFFSESQRLATKLEAAGAKYEFVPFDGRDHGFDVTYVDLDDYDKGEEAQKLLKCVKTLEKWMDAEGKVKL